MIILYLYGYNIGSEFIYYTRKGVKCCFSLELYLFGYYYRIMNRIGEFVKQQRKALGLTQEEFAIRSGLGLRFVRDLEQGKATVRLDKVNQALSMFGMEAVPGRAEKREAQND